MAWIVVFMGILLSSEASLPSVSEVMARSRWCVGEGGKCPINLPMMFPSCCKPFICTAIPKTRTPTRFLKFSVYKDYRCVLSANATTQSLNPLDDLVTTTQTGEEGKEGDTPLSVYINSSVDTDVKNSHIETEESQLSNTSSVQAASQENSNNENDYKYESVNETQSDDYDTTYSKDLPDNDTNEIETKLIVKRSAMNESSYFGQDSKPTSPFNFSSAINQSYSFVSSEVSLPTNDTSEEVNEPEEVSDVQINKTTEYNQSSDGFNSSEYYYEQNKTDGLSFSNPASDESISTSTIMISPDILHSSMENISLITNTSPALLSNVTSTEDSEGDWHSSQMEYDTRPVLHKVVTIPPFHLSDFFQSVEVVKLNVSSENSLDG